MRNKEDRFTFTHHSLERGLQRILGIAEPYTQEDYNKIKVLILRTMNWNIFSGEWELRDYGLHFVIRNDKVITIEPLESKHQDITKMKPISQYHKEHLKVYMKKGRENRSNK